MGSCNSYKNIEPEVEDKTINRIILGIVTIIVIAIIASFFV